jgi:hypothetical protein
MKTKPLPDAPLEEAAGTEQALDFVRGLQRRRADKTAVKKYIDGFSLGTLQSVARRIMMDVLKAPQVAKPRGTTGRRRPNRER